MTFFERTKDGIARKIGKAKRPRGRIRFKPASTGQRARVEAIVVQNGFPRETITVDRFRATSPTTPGRVRAERDGGALVVTWKPVEGATGYRVDVFKGQRRVARRTVDARRVRIKEAPAARLRVEVRALLPDGAVAKPGVETVPRAER